MVEWTSQIVTASVGMNFQLSYVAAVLIGPDVALQDNC